MIELKLHKVPCTVASRQGASSVLRSRWKDFIRSSRKYLACHVRSEMSRKRKVKNLGRELCLYCVTMIYTVATAGQQNFMNEFVSWFLLEGVCKSER